MHEAALTAYLGEQRGAETTVVSVDRITVGHSRAMYRVDTVEAGRFVVRVEQGGVFGTSGGEEFGVMRALHDRGFPVANVRWYEPTGEVLGAPFFVMDFIDGAEGADERVVDVSTCEDFVCTLRRLHELDATSIPFASRPPSAAEATHFQIERWAGVYRTAGPAIALLDEAAAWLHLHAPPLARLSVVHGDAGPGNFVHAGGKVVAVTDWEFAHLGDPAEDWSFCLSMRGVRTLAPDEWKRIYRQLADVDLSPPQWAYWEAFNLFKGACANRTCLTVFEQGANRAPNMAIIGTTLHQVFLRRLVDLVGRNP